MLDSAHKDTGRWRLLGIRERVRIIQEWITWETRQDISDDKNERSQDNECESHNHFTSRRACWEYQARLQEGWSEWVATWLSKEEAEHNRVSAQSARTGRALNNSGHLHAEADNSNPNETEAGISSAQPIPADHQTAPLSNTMTGGNTREHLDHPVGRTVCSEMDEGQKSAADGRQKNIEVDTQQLPVTIENQRCGGTEEEGARMRAAVRKSTRIAARGQRTDYTEVPRYDLPADWAQPYGKAEGVAIAKSRTPGAGYGLYGIKPRTRNSMLFKEAGEFVCVYATEGDLITCSEAQTADSDCIWTTSRQFQADWDPDALYFDPSLNRHYGKSIINDHWKLEEN